MTEACNVKILPWRGSAAAYLGKRRWELTIACPGKSATKRLELGLLNIFKIPPGCTGNSEEWLFPAIVNGVSTMTPTMSTPLHHDIEHSVVKKEKIGRESIQKTEEIHEVDRLDNIEQLIRQNENVKNQINIWQSS